jgi:anti-anti-sigma regulatory factor
MVQVSGARGWDLEVERGPDWLFVRPIWVGSDTGNKPSLAPHVWSLLEQTLMHRLVLDLSNVDRFDTGLFEQLVWLQKQIHDREGIMRICGLSSGDQELLRKLCADGQIAHYCDREAAVMGYDHPRHPR